MKTRLSFKCWNAECRREYSLLRDLQGLPKLFVTCPFCEKEGVVDLDPFRENRVEVFKGDKSDKSHIGEALNLPDTIPTMPPEA